MISQSEAVHLIESEFPRLTRLGFEPVTYSQITQEKKFWQACKSCVNYQTLLNKDCKNCLCTAMLYTPDLEIEEEENEGEPDHRHSGNRP